MSAPIAVDVAVVGGGIAGVSVAAELADAGARVAVLEQEGQLAYHATGRSAAAFLESYGSPEIRALTHAARPCFDAEGDLLSPRPLLWLAQADEAADLAELIAAEPSLRRVDETEVRRLCPAIRPGWLVAAAIEEGAQDIDVAGLFEHYRRRAVRRGVTLLTGAGLRAAHHDHARWRLDAGPAHLTAPIVVNAAGAWADDVAVRCGARPLGLRPLRRTIAIASGAVDRAWPLVGDLGEGFYFRPEGDALLVSPADETPAEPGDARASTEDVALALDRVNEATTLGLRHVRHTWAGLRTFAPDRNPVVGYDPAVPGLFWLAGQGGYGMQTAPALALLAAALVRGEPPPPRLAAAGFDAAHLHPARFTP